MTMPKHSFDTDARSISRELRILAEFIDKAATEPPDVLGEEMACIAGRIEDTGRLARRLVDRVDRAFPFPATAATPRATTPARSQDPGLGRLRAGRVECSNTLRGTPDHE